MTRLIERLVAACLLALLAAPAWAQRAPGIVDGELWLSSTPEVRKAFLIGAGNMMALETAYAKKRGTPVPTASDMTSKAIGDLTLDQMSNRITKWYEANPGRRNMPVMAVVWVDMVRPGNATR